MAESPDVARREDVVVDLVDVVDVIDATAPDDPVDAAVGDTVAAIDAVDLVVPVDAGVDARADAAADTVTDSAIVRDVIVGRDAGVDASADASCAPQLVVNEVQVAGTTAADEFVELHNNAACAVALTGWTVRYAAAAGTVITVKWTGVAGDSIPARGYAVLAGEGFVGRALGVLAGTTGVLAAAGGGVGLYDPLGVRVDSVGYGTATNPLVEAMAAPAPAASQSIQRAPDGADTDRNQIDLHVAAPTPGAVNR